MCLKKTKEGYPIHPLYVAADTEPTKYELIVIDQEGK
jgi:hypothetical protein